MNFSINRRKLTQAAVGALFGLALSGASAQEGPAGLTSDQTYSLAKAAYLYAYPLVSMEVTKRQAINVADASTVSLRAPVNQFAHARAYPTAQEKDVVRYNFDTLYSMAWLDLASEPVILSVPDTQDRYYLLPMLDMWSDVFAVVGTRTTGNKAGTYALVAPGWTGKLPDGAVKIVAPTPSIWIIGRTKTNGPSDYVNVHQVQDGYKLVPLSQWGTNYVAPKGVPTDASVDNKTPPLVQVNALDGMTMLTRLAELLSKYPPHPNDYPMLLRLRALGIEPGKPFDATKLAPQTVALINKAAKEALAGLPAAWQRSGQTINGWNMQTDNMGTYGTSYLKRTLIAAGGLGANLPDDALYPTASFDGEGKVLSGQNKYVLLFDKGQTPPANAFWSITMYDTDGFQVPNAISRYAVGSYDKFVYNADGSLDILIQADSPAKDRGANWLPAPRTAFQPTMRIYSPRSEALDGAWVPPPIKRVN